MNYKDEQEIECFRTEFASRLSQITLEDSQTTSPLVLDLLEELGNYIGTLLETAKELEDKVRSLEYRTETSDREVY